MVFSHCCSHSDEEKKGMYLARDTGTLVDAAHTKIVWFCRGLDIRPEGRCTFHADRRAALLEGPRHCPVEHPTVFQCAPAHPTACLVLVVRVLALFVAFLSTSLETDGAPL